MASDGTTELANQHLPAAELIAAAEDVATYLSALECEDDCATVQRLVGAYRSMLSELEQVRKERDAAHAFLESEQYRRCDIAACNCGSWHKYGELYT